MLLPDHLLSYATLHFTFIFDVGTFLAGIIVVKLVKRVTYPEHVRKSDLP